MQLTLRAKLLLVIFIAFTPLAAGCLYLLRKQSVDLVRPIAFMSLNLSINNLTAQESSGETPASTTGADSFTFLHEWSFKVPLGGVQKDKILWTKQPSLSTELQTVLAKNTFEQVKQTGVLAGSFELNSDFLKGENRNHFVSFKKVGENIIVVGTSSSTLMDTIIASAGSLSLVFSLCILLVAVGVFFISTYLTRSLNIFSTLLDNIGAGRIEDVEVPRFSDPEMNRVSDSFKNTLAVLSRQSEMISKISKIADEDAMTGLPNYRAFIKYLEISKFDLHNQAPDKVHIMALIDIDFFKKVNDTYGHQVGDFVLKNLGKILVSNMRTKIESPSPENSTIRRTDFCARYGGEEFIAVFLDCKPDQRLTAPIRILNAIKNTDFMVPAEITGDKKAFTLKITASIGVATWNPKEHPDFKAWIKSADMSLYDAKKRGRARVVQAIPTFEEHLAQEAK